MDPDGDYESRHSTRSIDDVFPTDAKLDDLAEGAKKFGNGGLDKWKGGDEEMGLKPIPIDNPSKVVLTEAKAGSVDLKPSAPPLDEECQPSAPPLEPSLHPSPEDAAATCTPSADNNTSECNGPPEPPGFKDDPIERSNAILDSVTLPIGLECADRGLPVASAVPIITNATGAEVVAPTTHQVPATSSATEESTADATSHQSTTSRSTSNTRSTAAHNAARRVPPFLREPSTHPAPEQPVAVRSATATLADPQSPREERDKRESRGCKCTPCKKVICVAVVIIAAIVAVGLTIALKPDPGPDPDDHKIAMLYPNCHVFHQEWIGDGTCNGGNYNKRGCGWDGGDCIKKDWPSCHADSPEAFRGLGNGKCNAAFDVIECGFDLGDCRPNWSAEHVTKLKELVKTYPGCFFGGMDMDWIGDGICDSGLYDRDVCGRDGGDCIVEGYPNCHVEIPDYIGDDACDGGEYNTANCGWDGGDCLEFNRKYPNCEVGYPYDIGDDFCDGGQYNTLECGWDGGDCLNADWPNCHIDNPDGLGNGQCNKGSKADAIACGFDGGDCMPDIPISKLKRLATEYPNCGAASDNPDKIGDGQCHGGEYNTAECGWDGGDCLEFNRRYPDCHVYSPWRLNDDSCWPDHYNSAACGYDGGDCLFNRSYSKACQGSVRSTWTNKTRKWCQYKCMDEGNNCKAYDFSYHGGGTCRIFSSYSSMTSKGYSRCIRTTHSDP